LFPQILDHLLSVTHMGAALALPGVLALVAALARDLQAEFVTTNGRLARVLKALAVLLDVQGGYHNPDVIEQVSQAGGQGGVSGQADQPA
jgi:hypothetical protein